MNWNPNDEADRNACLIIENLICSQSQLLCFFTGKGGTFSTEIKSR